MTRFPVVLATVRLVVATAGVRAGRSMVAAHMRIPACHAMRFVPRSAVAVRVRISMSCVAMKLRVMPALVFPALVFPAPVVSVIVPSMHIRPIKAAPRFIPAILVDFSPCNHITPTEITGSPTGCNRRPAMIL